MFKKREIGVILALVAMLSVSTAQAHGLASDGAGFLGGFFHPVLGLDHVLVMLTVGLLGAQQGGRAVWRLPLAFAAMLFLGAMLALTGPALPTLEAGITTSVVALGLLLAIAPHIAPSLSLGLAGAFALFHGYAHGAAMLQMVPAFSYLLGLVIATAVLPLAGIALGGELRRAGGQWLLRCAGAVIACSGMLLWA